MKRVWFYTIVVLQVAFLLVMAVGYYAMDQFGETVHLRTAPVDPRDPFYGDYVILNYEVETIPASKWIGSEEVERGEKVFLLLEQEKDLYQLLKASDERIEAKDQQVVMEARMEWHDQTSDGPYSVDLGLGRYYVEENTGGEWEGTDSRIVEVVLAPWGQKKINSIQ
ncbi:GDYXXLXY domain-containing protein [Halobacillus locisalis]|uniref:GDYXXLXY domain-containing protein n=1 Tax=Halobacillus locisalis TaxID=220753 RepID=A0A838CRN6_9BACI|nr:GDYXXLXY domain-containing protein [Halobacillus locisalis]MBA2174523.1 GDYXXLXY domain-containing protein [Halobacillus locisalis]